MESGNDKPSKNDHTATPVSVAAAQTIPSFNQTNITLPVFSNIDAQTLPKNKQVLIKMPTGTSGGLVVGSPTSFIGKAYVGAIEGESRNATIALTENTN